MCDVHIIFLDSHFLLRNHFFQFFLELLIIISALFKLIFWFYKCKIIFKLLILFNQQFKPQEDSTKQQILIQRRWKFSVCSRLTCFKNSSFIFNLLNFESLLHIYLDAWPHSSQAPGWYSMCSPSSTDLSSNPLLLESMLLLSLCPSPIPTVPGWGHFLFGWLTALTPLNEGGWRDEGLMEGVSGVRADRKNCLL